MTTPTLPLLQLTDDQSALVAKLLQKMRRQHFALKLSDAFYDAEQVIEDLGISIPPELSGLHTVCGWGASAVDPLEERLDLEGFRYPDALNGDTDLWQWWQANRLDVESSLAHVDTFVHGHSFVAIGTGDGGPNGIDTPPVITPESAHDLAAEYDARGRDVVSCVRRYRIDQVELATLYVDGATIHLAGGGNRWEVIGRDDHGLPAPVVRMANRQRTNKRDGRSEITTAVRSLVQSGCRTLLGLEVAREFYAAPRRYALGAAEDAWEDQEGNPVSAWEAYAGRVWGLTRDEEGNLPEVGTFAAYDPTAFTRIIEQYARLMCSETGLPPGYLGIATDQPASADAIRQAEQRLVKRAERRQRVFGEAWEDVMRFALLVQTGTVPDRALRLETVWRDPSTPTRAAQTDSAVKLVQAGIIPADSPLAAEIAGLTPSQQARLAASRQRTAGASALDRITARAGMGSGTGEAGIVPAPVA